MLYGQLRKASYGTLQAALPFWKLLSETLQEWGFVLNPNYHCIANKIIEVKWHANNLKILQIDKDMVEDIIQ